METESNKPFVITVDFKGKKFEVALNESTTLAQLQKEIEEKTDVPVKNQKLLVPKKLLQNAVSITLVRELFESKNVKKIKLMGLTSADKTKLTNDLTKGEELEKKLRIKNDLDLERFDRERKAVSKKYGGDIKRRKEKPEYRFYKIKVLDEFQDRSKAKKILKKLANDPGILSVLKEYKWKIPVLSEMYPEGKVGISAVCILGLNVNKGQEIKLRIRTDDLKGFRKYNSMLEVLCHELAHNKFSEHDDQFYQFMSVIQRKVKENNWKISDGLTVGGKKAIHKPRTTLDVDSEDFSDSSEENHNLVPFSGSSFVVGRGNTKNKTSGRTDNDDEFDGLSLREKAALAARKRLEASKGDSKSNRTSEDDKHLP